MEIKQKKLKDLIPYQFNNKKTPGKTNWIANK